MQMSRTHDGPRARTRRRLATLVTGAVILSGGMVAVAGIPAAADDCSTVPWMDTSTTSEERANALLDASSQHQKYRWLVEQPANTPTRTDWAGGVVYPVQVPCTPTVIYANGPDGVYTRASRAAARRCPAARPSTSARTRCSPA
jgi:beta-glucosidase